MYSDQNEYYNGQYGGNGGWTGDFSNNGQQQQPNNQQYYYQPFYDPTHYQDPQQQQNFQQPPPQQQQQGFQQQAPQGNVPEGNMFFQPSPYGAGQAGGGGGGGGGGMGNFNPVITNFAKEYGQNLVGQGKEMVDQKIQKFVSVSKLKYYFAVDTTYVLKKIGLLFFPFTHKDWSIRFNKNEDDAIQPRFEVNAPDLYIPLMAFITFILVAGVSLGMQQKFTPEVLGIQASSALGWLILELMISTGFIYILQTDLKVLDVMSFSSYKFVGMILILLASILINRTGFYLALGYFGLCLVVFLIRTLKVQIYSVASHEHVVSGSKRRLYFVLAFSGIQPLLMWFLTYHLAF